MWNLKIDFATCDNNSSLYVFKITLNGINWYLIRFSLNHECGTADIALPVVHGKKLTFKWKNRIIILVRVKLVDAMWEWLLIINYFNKTTYLIKFTINNYIKLYLYERITRLILFNECLTVWTLYGSCYFPSCLFINCPFII